MVVFGGYGYSTWVNDVWALSLSESPAWGALAPAGSPPAARELHTAIYDLVRDRMVVFGGHDAYYHNDVSALTWGAPPPPVEVDMAFDLSPNPLNLRSRGLWVMGRLEPPSPFTPSDIDIASIRLNGTVPVDPSAPISIGSDLKVRFDRAAVERTVSEGDNVPISVTGTVGGTAFSATVYVRVRRAVVSAPPAGSRLVGGVVAEVRWETTSADSSQPGAPPDTLAADSTQSVALLFSLDNGSTWDLIASGQPNTGRYNWIVPNFPSIQAKVAVVLVQSADSTGDIVDGVLGVSEAFVIEAVVGVGEPGPGRLGLLWAAPNPVVDGRLRVKFTLRDGGPARVELMDVAGRVVSTRQVGGLGPGTHALDLPEGGTLRPGIYFLRLTQRGSEVRGRAAVMK